MTEAERHRFLLNTAARWVGLRGAQVGDVLDILHDRDELLPIVEPFWTADGPRGGVTLRDELVRDFALDELPAHELVALAALAAVVAGELVTLDADTPVDTVRRYARAGAAILVRQRAEDNQPSSYAPPLHIGAKGGPIDDFVRRGGDPAAVPEDVVRAEVGYLDARARGGPPSTGKLVVMAPEPQGGQVGDALDEALRALAAPEARSSRYATLLGLLGSPVDGFAAAARRFVTVGDDRVRPRRERCRVVSLDDKGPTLFGATDRALLPADGEELDLTPVDRERIIRKADEMIATLTPSGEPTPEQLRRFGELADHARRELETEATPFPDAPLVDEDAGMHRTLAGLREVARTLHRRAAACASDPALADVVRRAREEEAAIARVLRLVPPPPPRYGVPRWLPLSREAVALGRVVGRLRAEVERLTGEAEHARASAPPGSEESVAQVDALHDAAHVVRLIDLAHTLIGDPACDPYVPRPGLVEVDVLAHELVVRLASRDEAIDAFVEDRQRLRAELQRSRELTDTPRPSVAFAEADDEARAGAVRRWIEDVRRRVCDRGDFELQIETSAIFAALDKLFPVEVPR